MGCCAPLQQEQQQGYYLPWYLERTDECSHPVLLNCVSESCCRDFEHLWVQWGCLWVPKYKPGPRCCYVLADSCSLLCVSSLTGHLGPSTPAKKYNTVPFTSLGICIVLGFWKIPGCVSFIPSLSPFSSCRQTFFPFPFWPFGLTYKCPIQNSLYDMPLPEYCTYTQWSSSKWSKGIPPPSPAGLQPSCSAKAAGKNIAVIRDKARLSKLMILPY